MPKTGLSAALVALLAAVMAFGTAGCFLPVLTIIPSVISLAHAVYTMNSGTDDSDNAKNQAAEEAAEAPSTPLRKMTSENLCQMLAITRPNLVLVELRKNGAGAPEYRELRMLNSADEAHWAPIVDSETGPNGWLPAVNFLKMDFNPPLTAAIPDAGTCYLAYAPSAIDPNDPNKAAELKASLGSEEGTFSWAGQVYEYAVARTAPCLSQSSLQ
jgi:hypothetical protein